MVENGNIIFELDNIFFNYPHEEPVLCGINLKINSGERICLLGANGSGKSTLLRLLSGLIYPKKGRFIAFGREVNEKAFMNKEFSSSYHKRTGSILGLTYLSILMVNVALRKAILLDTLVVVGVYFLFQTAYYMISSRKYIHEIMGHVSL